MGGYVLHIDTLLDDNFLDDYKYYKENMPYLRTYLTGEHVLLEDVFS